MTDFDFSEVLNLADDLVDLPDRLSKDTRKATKKALQNVKDETRANVSRHPKWSGIAYSVNYDFGGNKGSSFGEVGYDYDGLGKLGAVYEFGAPKRNRPPHPTLIPAAEAEAPRFVEAVSDTAKDWLR